MENSRHDEFTHFLIQHEPELIRYVMVAVPNRTDARDIMQECSVSLWNKFATFDSNRSFVPWALGFVRIEIRRFLRKSARRSQLTERAASLLLEEHDMTGNDLDARHLHLQTCVSQLSERQKQVVDGYYRMEQSVDELSQRTGQTVEAIYKSLQRIRRVLHDCINSRMRTAE